MWDALTAACVDSTPALTLTRLANTSRGKIFSTSGLNSQWQVAKLALSEMCIPQILCSADTRTNSPVPGGVLPSGQLESHS